MEAMVDFLEVTPWISQKHLGMLQGNRAIYLLIVIPAYPLGHKGIAGI